MDEGPRRAQSDVGKRRHGAGADDRGVGEVAAAGHRRLEVVGGKDPRLGVGRRQESRRHFVAPRHAELELVSDDRHAGIREAQRQLAAGVGQHLHESHRVGRRAGDADEETGGWLSCE